MRQRLLGTVIVLLVALATGCGAGAGTGNINQLLEEGWRAYATGEFAVAANLFRTVENTGYATEKQLFSARLGLATAYHLSTDPDLETAQTYYTRLNGMDVPGARRLSLLGRGKVALERGRTDEGRRTLEKLQNEFPESAEADEATVHLAESYFHPQENPDLPGGYDVPSKSSVARGIRVLEYRLTNHPENALAAVMHMMLADRYTDRGEFRKAVDHLQQALRKGIVSARTRSELMWQVARTAEKELEDYRLAEEYYQRFVETSRRHVLFYRARQSLERVRDLLAQKGE